MTREEIARMLQDRDIDRVLITNAFTGHRCDICQSDEQINHVAHFYRRNERVINGVWKPFSHFTSWSSHRGPESLHNMKGLCPSCKKIIRGPK